MGYVPISPFYVETVEVKKNEYNTPNLPNTAE